MKLKSFLGIFILTLFITSCKSRFTSTSDASGPRRHEYADARDHQSSTTNHSQEGQGKHVDSNVVNPNLTEIRDSGNVAPIITREDSASSIRD